MRARGGHASCVCSGLVAVGIDLGLELPTEAGLTVGGDHETAIVLAEAIGMHSG